MASTATEFDFLEVSSPEEILSAFVGEDTRGVVLGTAFGPGSICIMHMLQENHPGVRVYFIDTGFHFPETHQVLRRWRERGLDIEVVRPALRGRRDLDRLWETDPDRCCSLRKVKPNLRALEGARLWITGLRRDQGPTRRDTPILQRVTLPSGREIDKLAPLANWSRDQVWKYILRYDLPYNTLNDAGYPSVGCTHCTVPAQGGSGERSGRWATTAKTECGLHLHAVDDGYPNGSREFSDG